MGAIKDCLTNLDDEKTLAEVQKALDGRASALCYSGSKNEVK